MGKKRSKKSVATKVAESIIPISMPDSPVPPPQPTPQPNIPREIQAQAMEVMMSTLMNNNRGCKPTSGIFSSDPLDHNQFINEGEEDAIEYIVEQREIFQPYACQICKAVNLLKRCVNCKMISYCSREHQKEHWPKHKDLCKAICKLCKRDGINNLYETALDLSRDMYQHYRIKRIDECAQVLGRQLDLWEREMFYYASACQKCFQADRKLLTTCGKCLHVNYCQPEHLNSNHEKWCSAFQIYRDIIFYQAAHGMIQPELPNRVLAEFQPLSNGMRRYLLEAFGARACMQWNRITYPVLTDIATCPLTALFALHSCNLQPETKKELTIHMVGAELHFEADTVNKWETLFLHLLPKLDTLRVVFVGPELHERSPEVVANDNCCRKCRAMQRTVIYQFYPRCFYHDYVKLESYSEPDLICAFNAGLYRATGFAGEDTWPPSIQCMLRKPNIPVVVTAYTSHELPKDVQRMEELSSAKMNIILQPMENPFSSSKPSLNFIDEDEVPIIYKNFYIAIASSK